MGTATRQITRDLGQAPFYFVVWAGAAWNHRLTQAPGRPRRSVREASAAMCADAEVAGAQDRVNQSLEIGERPRQLGTEVEERDPGSADDAHPRKCLDFAPNMAWGWHMATLAEAFTQQQGAAAYRPLLELNHRRGRLDVAQAGGGGRQPPQPRPGHALRDRPRPTSKARRCAQGIGALRPLAAACQRRSGHPGLLEPREPRGYDGIASPGPTMWLNRASTKTGEGQSSVSISRCAPRSTAASARLR